MESLDKILEKIDEHTKNKDVKKMYEYINKVNRLVNKEEYSEHKVQLYYSIATTYSDIYQIMYNKNRINLKNKEKLIEKQIYFYLKAIKSIEFEKKFLWLRLDEFNYNTEIVSEELRKHDITDNDRVLFAQIHINLGNCYSSVYRINDAIFCFNKALVYYPGFFMSIGNLGVALHKYSFLYTSHIKDVLNKLSYYTLNYVVNNEILFEQLYKDAYIYFKNIYNNISKIYTSEFLLREISDYGYGKDANEIKYKTWVAAKGLFLNPYNDYTHVTFAACDMLHLPNMIGSKGENIEKYLGLINQIKQEYVSSRYLLYLGTEGITEAHFSDRENQLVDTLDYSCESLYDYLVKNCYKSMCSLLDRVAYFINGYFNLGIKDNDVNFISIWLEEITNKQDKYKYRNSLKKSIDKNIALQGLYWLSKDLLKNNYKDSKISKLIFDYRTFRNHLEHKYVKTVKDNYVINERNDGLAYYITECELYIVTLEMIRYIRSIIILLISAVDINETNKRSDNDFNSADIPHIEYPIIEDEWKI